MLKRMDVFCLLETEEWEEWNSGEHKVANRVSVGTAICRLFYRAASKLSSISGLLRDSSRTQAEAYASPVTAYTIHEYYRRKELSLQRPHRPSNASHASCLPSLSPQSPFPPLILDFLSPQRLNLSFTHPDGFHREGRRTQDQNDPSPRAADPGASLHSRASRTGSREE
jgi:hypothetical protein